MSYIKILKNGVFMRILITGSSGNVGFFLVKYFITKRIPVIGVDTAENNLLIPGKYFKFIKASVTDAAAVLKIFSAEKPTHVIHLAYLMKSLHDERREFNVDVNGSINVINAANKTMSVRQFIEFSSTSAYGGRPDNRPWIKETQPLAPGGYRYGVNKKEVEEYINSFKSRKGLKFVIVRMCTAIGPDEYKKGGLVELMVKSPFLIKFGGSFLNMQLIHQHDLALLIHKIIRDKDIQGTYNLVPDDYCPIRELEPAKTFLNLPLWLVKAIIGIMWRLRLSGFMPAAMDLNAYGIIADPSKLVKRYGYRFKFSTLAGYKDSVAGMKRRGVL